MGRPQRPGEPRPRRSVLVALLLACATLITLDFHGGTGSPVEPVRRAVGEVFGPVESAAAGAVRPLTAVPDWFRSRSSIVVNSSRAASCAGASVASTLRSRRS